MWANPQETLPWTEPMLNVESFLIVRYIDEQDHKISQKWFVVICNTVIDRISDRIGNASY